MFQNICKGHPLLEKSLKSSQSTLHAAVLPFGDNSLNNPFVPKNQQHLRDQQHQGISNKKKVTYLSQSQSHGQLLKKNQLITSKVSQTDTIKEEIHEDREGSSDNHKQQLLPPGSYDKNKRTNRNSQGNQSASSSELQRIKSSQRQSSEFYDIGGTVYKNYKYEKLKKLHRPEFAFLSKLPLDFVGKCFAQKQQIKIISPEDALNNLKMQHFIEGKDPTAAGKNLKEVQSRAISAGKVETANELDPMREIKRKLQESLIDRQKRVDFLEKTTKINSNLEKLDSSIRQQRNLINRTGNSSQFVDIHSAQNHSLSQNNSYGGAGEINGNSTSNSVILLKNLNSSNLSTASNQNNNNNSIQWISPLIRHDNMTRQPRAPPLAGSDYILKCELLQKLDSQQQPSNKNQKITNNTSNDQSITIPSQNQSQHAGDQMCLSVIYINKAMKGRGKKLHSLLQHDQSIKDEKKTMSAGKLARSLKYKSQNILIAEEYNRLIQLQRDEIAKNNTKRIPTKLQTHQDNVQITSKKSSSFSRNESTGVRMLLVQVFLRETTFFGLYVREDERIREKILGALTEQENGISFERYMEFYQIFAFSNTPQQVLIEFLCRYFLYSNTSILKAISLQSFLDELRVLVTHPQLTDRDEVFEQWEIALQSNSEFNYDMNFLLRKKHLENIFKESIVNPNLILKLLFQ